MPFRKREGMAHALTSLAVHRCKVAVDGGYGAIYDCGLQVSPSNTDPELFLCPRHGTISSLFVEADA